VFGITVATGRGAADNLFYFNCILGAGATNSTYTNMVGTIAGIGVEIVGSRFRGLTFAGSTGARIQGGESAALGGNTYALTGTAKAIFQGVNIENVVTVASGCTLTINGGPLNTTLTVAAGGAADVRGSNYGGNANLLGAGTINRTTWISSVGPTVVGANAVVLNPPYPDANYNVNLQLTAGAGAFATITGKTGAGFTINDSVGGNTFDYTVIHD
jgi:hypothetical protein